MQEEKKLTNESGLDNQEIDTTQDYISAINELKENSVPKEAFEKLKADNQKLLKNIVARGYNEKEPIEEKKDLDELRKDLFNNDHTNLEYCKKALELRKECIKQGKGDPFLPTGHNITPTDADVAAADRVADALEACVEYADGDSNIFTNELQRIMIDVPLPKKRR